MSDVAAEVRDLRMRYGAIDVLDGIDFDIRTGEVAALLGPNGAGKTTTIEILEGFRARSAGRVSVLGADPEHAGEQWRARLRGARAASRGARHSGGGAGAGHTPT